MEKLRRCRKKRPEGVVSLESGEKEIRPVRDGR